MKRAVIFLILFSMTIHCASRLGVLSYLYEKRHSVAYAFGLIKEVPIAMCNSEYDFNQGLTIDTTHEAEQSHPTFFTTSEIHLFCYKPAIQLEPELALIAISNIFQVVEKEYSQLTLSIFHPPS